ncbi:MAG: amino acid ABC transporter permease [Bacilli bacterium]
MNFTDVTLELLNGFGITCLLFIVTWILSIPLGAVFCSVSLIKNKYVNMIMHGFIWIIRGTPLMLQIIVVFYVPGLLFNLPAFDRMVAVIIAIVINYGVYFSEIFRAGYESIDKGQSEACKMLGMNRRQSFFRIILLQVVKKTIPPLSNETISLVKDTALARVIAINEVIMAAQKIVSTYAIIWVLFYTAVFYLVLNGLLSFLLHKLEDKLKYFEAK